MRPGEVHVKFDRLMEQLVGVIALLALVAAALFVIAPFTTALLWGAILAYCSWGPYQKLGRAFKGHKGFAALLIVLSILVIVIGPALYAGVAFSTRMPELVVLAQKRLAAGVPPLPDWVVQLPAVGQRLQEGWDALATHNPEVVQRLRELARPILFGTLGAAVSVLQGLGLLVLSVLFAGFFYLSGERLGIALAAAMQRIAGARAPELLGMVGGTVKGVVYGILGTSLMQAVLCGIGFFVAGLPSPGLLALATFFLSFIPGGPLLVVIPGAIWLAQQDQATWAIILVVWTLVVGITIDNVVKPMIIGKSSNMPFILILLGVIGGAAAFGLLGVFVGPTVLAVAYAVLRDWTATPEVQLAAAKAAPMKEHAPDRRRVARLPEHRPGEQPT
jgi:predicted PurR-regulated permease PerM